MSKELTAAEQVGPELDQEMEKVRAATKGYFLQCQGCQLEWYSSDEYEECPECESDDVVAESSYDQYWEGVLEFTKAYTVFKIVLSTGGPHDEFRVFVDPEDKVIDRIEYWFLPWFDGAHIVLQGQDLEDCRALFESTIEAYM